MSCGNFDKLKRLFIESDEIAFKILKIYNPESIQWKADELEYYCMLLSTKTLIDLITENMEDNIDLNESFQHLKTISKNINSFQRKLILAEILFTLLFLRFEDWEQKPLRIVTSDTSDMDGNPSASDSSGFMCGEHLVRLTLNFLKTFLLKSKRSPVYKSECEANKKHLQNLIEATNDALYRLKIISKCSSILMGGSLKIHSIHYGTLLKCHPIEGESVSSEDESDGNGGKYVSRKKKSLRKSIRASPDSDKTSTTCGSEQVLLDMKTSYSSEKSRPKKTINKLMSSPQALGVLCASRGDIFEIKNIIKVSKFLFQHFYICRFPTT